MMTQADVDSARAYLADATHLNPDTCHELAADLLDEVDRLREARDRYSLEVCALEADLAARRIRDAAAARVEAERYAHVTTLS